MNRLIKVIFPLTLSVLFLAAGNVFAQTKNKKELSKKRDDARRAMHRRDSLMRSLNKSDTSINSLLQRVEQYTTTFNQVKNNLAEGLDTVDIGQQLPPVIKRIDKISSAANTHKSSTLHYFFVLRDNLNHIEDELDGWQDDLSDVNTRLVQNQNDLIKFSKDTLLKTIPSDSLVRRTFFAQLRLVRALWRSTDSLNRSDLLKVNLLQDKIAVSYTKTLDESDQVESKIKNFAMKAISGEAGYIWQAGSQNSNFRSALNSTIRLNSILFNYFAKNETETHLISLLFLVLVFVWILYNRTRVFKETEDINTIIPSAGYVSKKPVASALLLVTAIIPYFYDHPPLIFIESCFLLSICLSFVLIKGELPGAAFKFLVALSVLAVAFCISNLFIEISAVDRFVVLSASALAAVIGYIFYRKFKKSPDGHLPGTSTCLKLFIALQILSVVLNVTGRFSLAKIIAVTAVFNLWLVVILYLVINIILQGLFLGFQVKRKESNIINWIDRELVQKKFRKALLIGAGLLWLFFLLQNLNIDDWAANYAGDFLNQSHSIGGATFSYGGFVIFIFVIWLSSIASRMISYLYDISAQRVTDLSVAKRKNRTSALIIRIAVFSVGFLLAVFASGFPLDKLTIIISAFGVGIGFGLQNIVNNLVSGLILAFEKPIQIGDVVEVDGHTGTMKEIGIRSSKVVTGDGSEVIIPNGDLISHQVINWTLSNSNRQIDLRVTTAYGVDIDKVKDMIKKLLSNREDVMMDPAPAVFLNNINEHAIEFRVLFWEADISKTGELKSRILAEIYALINKEGVTLPSTKNDVYVHFPEGVPQVRQEEKKPAKEKKDSK